MTAHDYTLFAKGTVGGNKEEGHAWMVTGLIDGTEAVSMTRLSAKVIHKCADTVERVAPYGTRAGFTAAPARLFKRNSIGKRIIVFHSIYMVRPYGVKRPLKNHERQRRL